MDLQELIDSRRGARSLQGLADDSGMTKQTWQTHVNPPPGSGRRIPEAATILAMAHALHVDPETVLLAIGETLGVLPRDRRRPALLDALPPHALLELLTADDVQTVVQLVNLLVGLRTEVAVPTQARRPGARRRPSTPHARTSVEQVTRESQETRESRAQRAAAVSA